MCPIGASGSWAGLIKTALKVSPFQAPMAWLSQIGLQTNLTKALVPNVWRDGVGMSLTALLKARSAQRCSLMPMQGMVLAQFGATGIKEDRQGVSCWDILFIQLRKDGFLACCCCEMVEALPISSQHSSTLTPLPWGFWSGYLAEIFSFPACWRWKVLVFLPYNELFCACQHWLRIVSSFTPSWRI